MNANKMCSHDPNVTLTLKESKRSTALTMNASMRPAAFFDRDGVINIDHGYIDTIERFQLVDGAGAALKACRDAGYLIFVVTNQSGIARGLFNENAVADIHAYMGILLAEQGAVIDDIRYCPHLFGGANAVYDRDCNCRKPKPGMLMDLVGRWNVDVARSFMVGDKTSDIAAAAGAGVEGFLFPGGDLADFVGPLINARASHGAFPAPSNSLHR